jgi:hypothetical protein
MTMTEETKKKRSDAGKRRALTNLQRFQVMETLKANGAKDGDKWWSYAEGWSDERIAKQVDCGETQVASIRRDCFGDIKPTPQPGHSPLSVLFAELKSLRKRVETLEAVAKRPANEDHTRLTLTGDNVTRQVVGFSVAASKPNGA